MILNAESSREKIPNSRHINFMGNAVKRQHSALFFRSLVEHLNRSFLNGWNHFTEIFGCQPTKYIRNGFLKNRNENNNRNNSGDFILSI